MRLDEFIALTGLPPVRWMESKDVSLEVVKGVCSRRARRCYTREKMCLRTNKGAQRQPLLLRVYVVGVW